jgi:hypothetical protein
MASSTGIADLRVVVEPWAGPRRIVGTDDRKVRPLWLKPLFVTADVAQTITVRNSAATMDIFMVTRDLKETTTPNFGGDHERVITAKIQIILLASIQQAIRI